MKNLRQFIEDSKNLWQRGSVFQQSAPKYAEKGKERLHPDGHKKLSHQEYYDLPKEKRVEYKNKYGSVYENFSSNS